MDVGFRALAESDLELLGAWLRAPHVAAWWRQPSSQADVVAKYLPAIEGREPTEHFVVVVDGEDSGLIQRYRTAAYPDWDAHLRATGIAPSPAAGVDYLIGRPELLRRGIGSQAISSFSAKVLGDWMDVRAVIACPQEDNRASCGALENAGFVLVWTGDLGSDDPSDTGTSAVYVLSR